MSVVTSVNSIIRFSDLNQYYSLNKYDVDLYNDDAIAESLSNLINTSAGERFFNRGFGANLKTLLFEPISQGTADDIRMLLYSAIKQYEPRVEVDYFGISITPYPDENLYSVVIYYTNVSSRRSSTFSTNMRQFGSL